MNKLVVVLVVGVVGCVGFCHGTADCDVKLVDGNAQFFNVVSSHLVLGGEDVNLKLAYPEEALLLVSDDGFFSTPYEPAYECGYLRFRVPRNLPRREAAAHDELRSVFLYRAHGLDGGIFSGRLGEVEFNCVTEHIDSQTFYTAMECLSGQDLLLAEAYYPRAYAEQMIRGKWTRLTGFRHVGVAYLLAPADTIRIRMKFSAVRVYYHLNRAEVHLLPADSLAFMSAIVKKPDVGYWPSRDSRQIFFDAFTSQKLECGKWFTFEYPIRPSTGLYTFDVFVIKKGVTQPLRLVLNFLGPALDPPDDKNSVLRWPLNPAIKQEGEEVIDDLGYPGSPEVPEWAFQELLKLGRGFLDMNGTNMRLYLDRANADFRKQQHNDRQ